MSYLLLLSSVALASLLVFFIKPNNKIVSLLLAFSGAYLLSVTILHLVPEVYTVSTNSNRVGIFILLGILIQSILEFFSKGAEHGHIHFPSDKKEFPVLLFISLCIHAFSEGLPIHSSKSSLLWAIFVHKIPITIVLTTFLLNAKYSKAIIFLFLFFFAIMSPLGMLLADKIHIFKTHIIEINSLIIGIFLHISSIILFESSENHKFNFQKFTAILLGILLTVFLL